MDWQVGRLTFGKTDMLAHSHSMDHKTGGNHEKRWRENPPKCSWQCLRLTAYKLVVFQETDMKLVTVLKILKRSLKWDQSGISSFIRSQVMSKTSEIVKEEGKK